MIMKINLGFNSKRYSRDMSFDNNTTYGFGEVQPLMCQYLSPDSDIKIGAKSLVRLSPLKYPSFARVRLELVSRFVPMSEVFAPFESLLSNIPYSTGSSTFIPSNVPSIVSNFLTVVLLQHSQVTLYKSDRDAAHPGYSVVDPSSLPSNLMQSVSQRLLGFPIEQKEFNIALRPSNNIKIDGADFVIEFRLIDQPTGPFYTLAARLLNSGLRLRKIFVGLGYECLSDNYGNKPLTVSLLPLIAFYKAYFDTYYPQRFVSFTNTHTFTLIQYLNNIKTPVYNISDRFNSKTLGLFANFFFELSECYYAAEDDYISIHTSRPVNQLSPTHLTVQGNESHGINCIYTGAGKDENVGALPHYQYGSSSDVSTLDNVLLRSIRLFTNYVSKDSVIGQRMSAWVKQHFNADLSNQLFKDSHFVGRHSIPLNISDVFSTSDTAQGSGTSSTGEHLGAFAGKGLGFGDLHFSFHSPVHGYLFVFACIVPESRTCQGTDATLLAIDRYSFPTPEFDALGFELTDRRVFIPSNDIAPVQGDKSDTPLSFGFVPRYTGFKYRKNISNGDMSRRSTSATMNPYYLDRLIEHHFVDGREAIADTTSIPSASPNWRFITRYGYLGHFNRIFMQDNDLWNEGIYEPELIDNFISQTIFNVRITDFLKPLKSSYDTVSDDDNNVKPITSE